jgi:hypothetical protein
VDAKLEAYDNEGVIQETKVLLAWFTWAEEEVDLCIALPEDEKGRGVQVTIPRKEVLKALERRP